MVGDAETVYLDLEDPRDRNRLRDPIDYLEGRAAACIIIDEVQLMPELFSVLRPLIDADRRPGGFILLGTASPQQIRGASESLAGRIGHLELPPLTLREIRGHDAEADHWIPGGYPDSLLAATDQQSELWRTNYLESYIMRELPALGLASEPDVTRRLLTMLAGQQGELANFSALGRALGVTQATVKRYLAVLTQSFLVRSLPPHHVNVRKRLVKAPKLYVRDSGLLHSLLGIEDEDQLTSSVAVGGSWGGYVVEQIVNCLPSTVQPGFYRTHAGAEIDLVLLGRRGRVATVEVKRSTAPVLTKGYHNAREDVGPEVSIVVAPVGEAYSLGQGVEVMGVGEAVDSLMVWAGV